MVKKHARRAPVRLLVLDVLKPHKPSILELGKSICENKTVRNVNISVCAMDEKTESIEMILEGPDINYDRVKEIIESYGAVVHSLDKVVLGSKQSIEMPKIKK